jgi:hypothetical protein
MAITMVSKDSNREQPQTERYGIVKIPTDHGISRDLWSFPGQQDNKHYIMFVEDVIMKTHRCHLSRVTRSRTGTP